MPACPSRNANAMQCKAPLPSSCPQAPVQAPSPSIQLFRFLLKTAPSAICLIHWTHFCWTGRITAQCSWNTFRILKLYAMIAFQCLVPGRWGESGVWRYLSQCFDVRSKAKSFVVHSTTQFLDLRRQMIVCKTRISFSSSDHLFKWHWGTWLSNVTVNYVKMPEGSWR